MGKPPPVQPAPTPTPTPPPPERSASQVQSAAAQQRAAFFGSDRTSTLLSSGSGADRPSTAVRLLGNVGR